MDYEKKYKEEVVRATQLWECGDITREQLEYIFPELAESEDEKIRKDVKRAISVALDYSYFDKETANNCLAWLEKQAEQKPCSWKPTEEQFEALDYAYNSCPDTERGNYYEGVLGTLIDDLRRFEKQGESYTKRDVDDAYVEGIAFAKNELEKQEQKPNWSEDDKYMIDNLIRIFERNPDEYYKAIRKDMSSEVIPIIYSSDIIDWLKSLKK